MRNCILDSIPAVQNVGVQRSASLGVHTQIGIIIHINISLSIDTSNGISIGISISIN